MRLGGFLLATVGACASSAAPPTVTSVVTVEPSEGAPTVQAAAVVHTPAEPTTQPVVVDGRIAWVAFDDKKLDAHLERGRPVFVSFFAEWCLNCQANHKLVLETESIHEVLIATNVLPMLADFTNENENIEGWIRKLGRSGIPVYVIFHPDGTRQLLPEAITVELLSQALRAAVQRPDARRSP